MEQPLSENFDFPRASVLCSTDRKILGRFRETGKSVVYRRPKLASEISAYVNEICTDKRHFEKMHNLDELLLVVEIADDKIIYRPSTSGVVQEKISQLGLPPTIYDLSEIFWEKNAEAFVNDLEVRIREDAQCVSETPDHLVMLFRTAGTPTLKFHKDRWPVLGTNYGVAGTEFGEEKDFIPALFAHGDEKDFFPKKGAALYQLAAGDISILNIPHRSGTCGDENQYRLWVGLYSALGS